VKFALTAVLLALLAAPASAQIVGRAPDDSPYRSLQFRQDVTIFSGWFDAGDEPAGVAPQGAPIAGVRYAIRLAGPVDFMARAAMAFSERTVINPRLVEAERVVGVESWPLLMADANFTLNVTGQKSWHGLVPTLSSGIGLVADMKAEADTGGFQFGTAFAFNLGAGLRWVATERMELRVDLTDYMYKIEYPTLYYSRTSDNTQVVPNTQPRSFWTHNRALVLGAAYRFWR
jgi:hypothetical protein